MKPYVAHDCKNQECNNRFMSLDDNGVTSRPPTSKYCPDCELFYGAPEKDPARVARGKALAAAAKERRLQIDWTDSL